MMTTLDQPSFEHTNIQPTLPIREVESLLEIGPGCKACIVKMRERFPAQNASELVSFITGWMFAEREVINRFPIVQVVMTSTNEPLTFMLINPGKSSDHATLLRELGKLYPQEELSITMTAALEGFREGRAANFSINLYLPQVTVEFMGEQQVRDVYVPVKVGGDIAALDQLGEVAHNFHTEGQYEVTRALFSQIPGVTVL